MREYPTTSTIASYFGRVALSVLSLAGCGNDSLENKLVETQASGLPISGTVSGGRLASPEPKIEQELDLSTPENPVKYFLVALKTENVEESHAVYLKVSEDLE